MLKLKHHGILERTNHKNETYDVTDRAISFLHEKISFDEDVTLRDLFLVINKDLSLFTLIFGNWMDEYTDVILNKTPDIQENDDEPVDYLRVYWFVENGGEEYNIPLFPYFDGIGICRKDTEYYKAGEEIKWGICSSMQNYVDILLKLEEKTTVYNYKTKEYKTYPATGYTLFNVIQAIIWEISFYGSPDDTNKMMESFREQIQRIKNGEEKVYSMEEVFGKVLTSEELDFGIEEEGKKKIMFTETFIESLEKSCDGENNEL